MSPTIMSGLKPCLEDRVGAAVDADEHRLDVADVGPQRAQVALVVDAAHDDQHRAVAEVGVEARQLELARRAAPARRPCARRCCGRTPRAPRRCRRGAARSSRLHRRRARAPCRSRSACPLRADLAVAQLDGVAVARAGRRGPRRARRPGGCRPARAAAGPCSGRCRSTTRDWLMTALTPDAIRSSPDTRSRSRWSITAISPGRSRFTSCLVRFPRRADPATEVSPNPRVRCRRPGSGARRTSTAEGYRRSALGAP